MTHTLKHIFKWVWFLSKYFSWTYPNDPVILQDIFQSLLLECNYNVIIDCFSMLLIILILSKSLALKNSLFNLALAPYFRYWPFTPIHPPTAVLQSWWKCAVPSRLRVCRCPCLCLKAPPLITKHRSPPSENLLLLIPPPISPICLVTFLFIFRWEVPGHLNPPACSLSSLAPLSGESVSSLMVDIVSFLSVPSEPNSTESQVLSK